MTETLTYRIKPTPRPSDPPNATRVLTDQSGYMLAAFPRENFNGGYDATGGPIAMYKQGTYECSATAQQFKAILDKLDSLPTKRIVSKSITTYEAEPGLLSNFCKKKPRPELDL